MVKLGRKVRVREATALADFRMRIVFEDGTVREMDLSSFLYGPVFEPVRSDPAIFRDVRIEGGTIAWANGADIDADVLYYGLTPAWMEETESSATR